MERWQRNLAILTICTVIMQSSFSMVMPFLPLYLQELGLRESGKLEFWSGLVFSGVFVSSAVMAPIWGAMADRSGRRPQILRSVIGMGLVVALMGLVQSYWQILPLRILQGVVAGFQPSTQAYVAANTPRERAGYAQGILQGGGAVGLIIGPLVGGLLARLLGDFRSIFFVLSAASAVVAILVWTLIHERFTPAPSSAHGVWGDVKMVLAQPVARRTVGVFSLHYFALMAVQPILPLFLTDLRVSADWLPVVAGAVFAAPGLTNLLVAPWMGRRGDRAGHLGILAWALLAASLIYLMHTLVTSAWQLVALRLLVGACFGAILPNASALVSKSMDRSAQGRAFGVVNSASSVGNTLGPLLGGAVAGLFGHREVFWLTALASAAAALLVFRMRPRAGG